MKRTIVLTLILLLCSISIAAAGMLDSFTKDIGGGSSHKKSDEGTAASGLKEALSVGTKNAVGAVSKTDGYFGNPLIKILMPGQLQKVADVLSKVGYKKEVDQFVLSMNRAAEKAAPQATSIFIDAIKGMTIEDAKGILGGGDTAATEFFKKKTQGKLYDAFKPVISSSMNEVGATKSYKEMMGKYESMPFVDKKSFDADHYVTNKALDGLFYMVGQEEKKIRTDPAARVTDLLKTVFK